VDLDGLGEGDLDGFGDREADGTNVGDGCTNVGGTDEGATTVWDRLVARDDVWASDGETVGTSAGAVVTATGLLDCDLALGRPAGVSEWWGPVKASRTILMANTTAAHATTTTVAVVDRRPFHLARLITCEIRAGHTFSARRATCRRYATASGASEEQRDSTCSRSPGGRGASGISPHNAAGRSPPSRWPVQVWHCSTCPAI